MINKLICVMEKEFDCFKKLPFLSRNEFLDVVSDIENLCLEEEKYIDTLPKNIVGLDNLSIMLHDFYKGDLSDKRFFVLLRLDNILESLKADIESDSLDDLLMDEFYDGYGAYNFAREKFLRQFAKDNREFCYLSSFSIKSISDSLISNNFNFDTLEVFSSKDDDSDFMDFYEEQLYLEAQNKLMNLFGIAVFDKTDSLFKYNMALFKSLLLNMNDFNFKMLKDDVSNSDFYANSGIYDEVISLFEEVSQKRPSFDNPVTYSIDIKLFDDLVSLIKFEEVLFNKYDSTNLSSDAEVKNFLSLINFESEILSSINFDEYDADILKDVVGRDIDFFLKDDSVGDLIGNRIRNLLPVFSDKSGGISKNYDYIIRNHIINSLDRYRNVICNVFAEDEAMKYIDVYKKIVFEYPDLFNDVIIMGCDFNILFSLDDVFTSKLLGFKSSINYSFDKDEILYQMGLSLIDEIVSMSNNVELFALYQFKICQFDDIINNVSMEHLYSLSDKVRALGVSKVRTKLLKKFSFEHKY